MELIRGRLRVGRMRELRDHVHRLRIERKESRVMPPHRRSRAFHNGTRRQLSILNGGKERIDGIQIALERIELRFVDMASGERPSN